MSNCPLCKKRIWPWQRKYKGAAREGSKIYVFWSHEGCAIMSQLLQIMKVLLQEQTGPSPGIVPGNIPEELLNVSAIKKI